MLLMSIRMTFPSSVPLFCAKFQGSPWLPPSPIMKYMYPSAGPKRIWPAWCVVNGSPSVRILLASVGFADVA